MTSPADSEVDGDTGTDIGADAVDTPEPEAGTEASAASSLRSKLPTIVLTGAVALLVAAATVAVWFGVAWFQAANDDGRAFSNTRDEVARVARAAIVTMNTLDHRKLDEGLADWSDATTGALHDEIAELSEKQKKALRDAKPVTSARILSSAVKELDDRSGKAVVIAAIEKTQTNADGKPVVSYQRVEATLSRTEEGGWKLEGLGPVRYAQPGQ